MTSIVFTVLGTPRAQPRGRHVGRRRPVSVTSPAVALWRAAVEREARGVVVDIGLLPPWCSGAVRVDTLAMFPTPKAERWGTIHTHKPDKDNVEKLILDCMKNAGLLPKGDERVGRGELVKVWGKHGAVTITLSPAVAPHVLAIPRSAPSWITADDGVPLEPTPE